METKAALVRSDCTVELYTDTSVDLYLAVVIDPWNTEHDYTVWLSHSLENGILFIFRIVINHEAKGINNFCYCLDKFRLVRIFCLDTGDNVITVAH